MDYTAYTLSLTSVEAAGLRHVLREHITRLRDEASQADDMPYGAEDMAFIAELEDICGRLIR